MHTHWGDSVPPAWNGEWPEELRTPAERSAFTRTVSTLQLHEFISALKLGSENVHVVNMFVSPLGKIAPAIVLAAPRITTPEQARASGKAVIYFQGNIHPPEPEATEALLMVARELATARRTHLLDNQIIIIAPILNVDGTDAFRTQDGADGSETPYILGIRDNAAGLDLNRDGVKLQTPEMNGLYRLLNEWDPVLMVDGHLMNRVRHGYANTYGTVTTPASHPGPRDYVHAKLFPTVRDMVRRDFGLEVFTHALFAWGSWPPTEWSHDEAGWTVDAKFVVNDYGLRNRMAIITETPGQPTFERRIYAQYAYFMALLEYTNAHASEMQAIVKAADDDTVARVRANAESGQLRNWLDGHYVSGGKIDILGYRSNVAEYLPGTSVLGTRAGDVSGEPEIVHDVEDLTVPVGTRDAIVPRGYLISAELGELAEKLRVHNVVLRVLEAPLRAEGEEFLVETLRKVGRTGYEMTVLDGTFTSQVREFPAGTFFVDMAQPMANAAFYYLEPQARDGFVGWGLLDATLRELGIEGHAVVYPIFKYCRELH